MRSHRLQPLDWLKFCSEVKTKLKEASLLKYILNFFNLQNSKSSGLNYATGKRHTNFSFKSCLSMSNNKEKKRVLYSNCNETASSNWGNIVNSTLLEFSPLLFNRQRTKRKGHFAKGMSLMEKSDSSIIVRGVQEVFQLRKRSG